MDAKLTLSFDAAVAEKAKAFAEANNISLSRLVEFMLSKVTDSRYRSIDELPVSDWIHQVAEGQVTYVRKNAVDRDVKKDYLAGRRKSK
jgi:antitoxin component of RelBE/YafQ-DinJ toxin-antitoxin module